MPYLGPGCCDSVCNGWQKGYLILVSIRRMSATTRQPGEGNLASELLVPLVSGREQSVGQPYRRFRRVFSGSVERPLQLP